MRRIAGIASAAFVAFIAIGLAPANASPADMKTASGLANCTYQLKRDAAVYEKPTRISPLLKHKKKGDFVRGFSRLTYKNESEGVKYRAVDIRKARDDIGWIDAGVLKRIGCDR